MTIKEKACKGCDICYHCGDDHRIYTYLVCDECGDDAKYQYNGKDWCADCLLSEMAEKGVITEVEE